MRVYSQTPENKARKAETRRLLYNKKVLAEIRDWSAQRVPGE